VNSSAQAEIEAYVQGVREALAGLPEATRAELLEDLPEHLAEVQAEGQGTLVDRLGSPEAYAAELLTTAGFVGGFPDPPRESNFVPLSEVRDNVLRLLGQADVKVGPVIGYEKASDFLVLLRPAWWVLRGYLAAMAITFIFDTGDNVGLLPRVGGSDVFALVLLGGCVVASILFGRRGKRLEKWPRYSVQAATVFLVVFALAGFANADGRVRDPGYAGVSNYDNNPYSNVQDVYVYDRGGKLVEGARLFDQDGSPIQLGSGWCSDPNTGESVHTRNMGYPYCPQDAPFGSPSPSVTPSDDAGVEEAVPGLPSPSEPTASPSRPGKSSARPGATPSAGLAPRGTGSASPSSSPSSSRSPSLSPGR
jgi:hypothetical protein